MKDHRRERLTARDGLSKAEVIRMSEAATANLFRIKEIAPGRMVMFYASFRSEVETFRAMKVARERGIRVVLPVSDPLHKTLTPRLIADLEKDLKPGYCSIQEPDASRTAEVAAAEIDVVVLPGSAFDLNGGRLGYGGGFYDRFLAADDCRALRVGLGFELQIVEKLPLEIHDQPLDALVTEQGVYRFAGHMSGAYSM
ncbi:MAG: 5-formyltetrahydrofolate cyclo-ligase [Proteobacteria bacterium]|nr:5-formyltetrahydrofolate cyclo-ligase [Pseudomonadota bacterium]MBU1737548.1 5-formyltetrahydrofolate cyclo-ligase [Pseudomonadota bacterium]